MARKVLFEDDTPDKVDTNVTLDALIPRYATNKEYMDEYKSLCDTDNAAIKKEMEKSNLDKYSTGGYTAKRVEAHKEVINETKLLEVAKKHNLPVIKTIEIVDTDLLENYLYHLDTIPDELATDLGNCKTDNVVVQLRITKTKTKEA